MQLTDHPGQFVFRILFSPMHLFLKQAETQVGTHRIFMLLFLMTLAMLLQPPYSSGGLVGGHKLVSHRSITMLHSHLFSLLFPRIACPISVLSCSSDKV